MSEFTKLGGYLIEGQPEVAHDNTLSGNGLEGSPLGLSEQVSEANDLVHSNSGTWNEVNAKLDTTAFSDVSGSFLTAVPAGTMNESAFSYDGSDNITAYNGSAIGGGSTPAYGYTDNDLISAIDTSGLYATSALESKNANILNKNGVIGAGAYFADNSQANHNVMILNPTTTPFSVTSGIYSPLQYAAGAVTTYGSSSYNTQYFGGFLKGNEWYVSNATAGQALRGETHASRGVHLSGATTAGYGFDLSIKSVSGVNSTGSWKYGHAEDAALRAVSSCDMYESAFEYDANDKISGYNGSAFAGGGEFPQSATEAIETVTANSADWNGTTETVSSNSGAWGGSALPISAGPGIKFEMVDGTLVASTDETVLFFAGNDSSGVQSGDLSESIMNFERIRVAGMDNDGHVDVKYIYPAWTKNADGFSTDGYEVMLYGANPFPPQSTVLEKWTKYSFRALTSFNLVLSYEGSYTANSVNIVTNNHKNSIREVVGINRIAGGN